MVLHKCLMILHKSFYAESPVSLAAKTLEYSSPRIKTVVFLNWPRPCGLLVLLTPRESLPKLALEWSRQTDRWPILACFRKDVERCWSLPNFLLLSTWTKACLTAWGSLLPFYSHFLLHVKIQETSRNQASGWLLRLNLKFDMTAKGCRSLLGSWSSCLPTAMLSTKATSPLTHFPLQS